MRNKMQNQTKTCAETTKHPSGLTWERWNHPFKMPHERRLIQQWMQRKTGQDLNDDPKNPF